MPRIYGEVPFPYLCLLISGGHTIIALVKSPVDFVVLESTLDDSIGELLDKVTAKIGLGHASELEDYAFGGRADTSHHVSTPYSSAPMSFSGLKTKYLALLSKSQTLCEKRELVRSLLLTVTDGLSRRVASSLKNCRDCKIQITKLVVSGGVASSPLICGIIRSCKLQICWVLS